MSKAFVATCALVALVCGLNAPVAGYIADHHTRFTFSEPIALPGVTLPAGTYTFRLVDPTTGGRVVQVLDGRGTRSYAMFLSIPASRPDVSREPEVSFMETAAGMPAAVKIWWPEGSALGHEFIYSKEQALRLTQSAIPESTVAEERLSVAADSQSAGQQSAGRSSAFANSAGQAQPAQPPPVTAQGSTSTPDQGAREELPQTASPLPLIVILGTVILFGGAWLMRKTHA